MVRNDYRRAFIMLRSAAPGYGGHVRLEKRTLTGNMYFIITAPEGAGPLYAALAGQRDGQYYAALAGALSRDRRGQLTLAWSFDPRSIDGRPLEAYAWVAVADAGSGQCALALTGNVEGSRPIDPAALERAVCALVAPPDNPAADLPMPDEPPARPLSIEAAVPQTPASPAPTAEAAPSQAEEAAPESDVKIYTRVRAARAEAEFDAPAVPANAETTPARVDPTPPAETEAAIEAEAPDAMTESPRTAAQTLGLDITCPWVLPAEGLRRLFATQAPVESPLGDEYVYIRGSLPASEGSGECLIGLRAADGQITAIRYALPGRWAPEPPAGLEDYRWDEAGFWVLDIGVS